MKRKTKGGRYRIECYYAPRVLVPFEAIERAFYETASPDSDDIFITEDGKECRPRFLTTWSEVNEKVMDDFCMDRWAMPFSLVRSLWFDRLKLRYGLTCWHYIELNELG